MTSQIDETMPIVGTPTTASVRANFATAKGEISALQDQTAAAPFLPIAGGSMTGPMYLYNDPTDVMMPATKGYVDANAGGGGGGGIPEAPADANFYARHDGSWQPVLPLTGGILTGILTLSGPPVGTLDAPTKAYVDAAPNQLITISGDASGSGTTAIALALAIIFAAPGTYQGLTIDGTGRITAAANMNYAPLLNPAFTGTPTAPTPAPATNSTQLATTAFVKNQGYATGGPYLPTVGGTISGALTVNGGVTCAGLTVNGSTNLGGNVGITGQVNATQGVFDNGYRVYSAVAPPGNLSVTGNLGVSGLASVVGNVNCSNQVTAGQGVFDAGYRVYSAANPPPALFEAALADLEPGALMLLEVGAEGQLIFRHAVLGPPNDQGQCAVLVERSAMT